MDPLSDYGPNECSKTIITQFLEQNQFLVDEKHANYNFLYMIFFLTTSIHFLFLMRTHYLSIMKMFTNRQDLTLNWTLNLQYIVLHAQNYKNY